jgi:hypothetical protein
MIIASLFVSELPEHLKKWCQNKKCDDGVCEAIEHFKNKEDYVSLPRRSRLLK